MDEYKILKYHKLTEAQKLETVNIFIDGFANIMTFTKDRELLKRLFLEILHPTQTLVYVENEKVFGVLGIGTNKVRPIKFDKDVCKKVFGKFKGTMISIQMNAVFQGKAVNEDTDLYIDVITTSKEARGKGVASKLFKHLFEMEKYSCFYLEVLSNNRKAKKLYQQLGFTVYKEKRFSPVIVLGLGYPIKMKKIVETHL